MVYLLLILYFCLTFGVGTYLGLELVWPSLNFPALSFGRLLPLYTYLLMGMAVISGALLLILYKKKRKSSKHQMPFFTMSLILLGLLGLHTIVLMVPSFRTFWYNTALLNDPLYMLYGGIMLLSSYGALYALHPSLTQEKGCFWLASTGIFFYIVGIVASGITEAVQWHAFDPYGNLEYAFIETVRALRPYYIFRAAGTLLITLSAVSCLPALWQLNRGHSHVSR